MDATRGPVLFRCDGTFEHGWEPFYQCLSLAAALQRRRRGTHFLSYLEPLNLAQTIHRGNNEWTPADAPLGSPGDLERTAREVRRLGAATVVVAGDGLRADYLAGLEATGVTVLVLDPAAALTHRSRLVLNLKAYAAARQGGDADLAWDTAASGPLPTPPSDVQFLTELPARSRRSRARWSSCSMM